MNRTASKRSSTFTTAQVVQMFMYEADSDEDHDECDDSGTDYDDPLSEVSEYSDTEAADPVVDTHAPVANASNDQTLPSRCGGQRGRKRGRVAAEVVEEVQRQQVKKQWQPSASLCM